MDETQVKHVIEAALLAAGRPLSLDTLASLFNTRASDLDNETLKRALESLAADYRERGLELKEVASGYRIQIKSSMSDWLTPLWEERAPRYTRALLETLALIAYRQPITRAEIEEVRGVAVSTNIVRTLMERNWVRVVGHRDVPGKPAMFGTTKEFLDYYGLKKLEDLPALADIKDGLPELSPQADFIEAIAVVTDDEREVSEQDEDAQPTSAPGGEVARAASFSDDGEPAQEVSVSDDAEGAQPPSASGAVNLGGVHETAPPSGARDDGPPVAASAEEDLAVDGVALGEEARARGADEAELEDDADIEPEAELEAEIEDDADIEEEVEIEAEIEAEAEAETEAEVELEAKAGNEGFAPPPDAAAASETEPESDDEAGETDADEALGRVEVR
jgi:segregation and condensation protein B